MCRVWRSTKNQESEFFGVYSNTVLCVLCVFNQELRIGVFFSDTVDAETDHSPPIDEFTTDKDERPMEHDSFGGGESIGASGGARRWVEPSNVHA